MTGPCQAGRSRKGGRAFHREGARVRVRLRGMGIWGKCASTGCMVQESDQRLESDEKGLICKAQESGLYPMGKEKPNRARLGFSGSYQLWHWSRK